MPELPEVETVVRGLRSKILGQVLSTFKSYRKDLRIEIPKNLDKLLQGKKIIDINRRAKYTCIVFENDWILVIHLGMSGRLFFSDDKNYSRNKHDHVILEFANGLKMIFNDPRRFGLISVCKKREVDDFALFRKLGYEPLSEEFSHKELNGIFRKRNKNIKSTLMDANLIVGIGNIYASEILFDAGIDPRKLAHTVTEGESKKLHKSIVKILEKAIAAGGSSIRDYVDSDGKLGYFQSQFLVYGRDDENCKNCKSKILKITQSNRSTYLCAMCQN